MATGSSYQRLADFLKEHPGDAWNATFSDIERVLGRALPNSASRYQAWWANQNGFGHSQTHGWRSAGWRTAKLDLERQRVRFERERGEPAGSRRPPPARASEDLFAQAERLSGIKDRDALIDEALGALIARESAGLLISLGGTMPDFSVPDRERPSA